MGKKPNNKPNTKEENPIYDDQQRSHGKDGGQKVTRNSKRNISCPDDKVVNDPSWYSKTPQLLKDAASIPFGRALGNNITFDSTIRADLTEDSIDKLSSQAGGTWSKVNKSTRIPGIMRINLIPGYGVSKDNNSALNLAVRNVYSYVRHANSGHSNYDAPDLGLYLISMDNAYTYWAWMVRLYGIMSTYNGLNRYYPKHLVESMGVDFDDLLENYAQFRAFINMFALKLSSLYVPTTMNVFTRHQWLYRNVYLDSPSSKAQTYYFAPGGFLEYDEYNGAGRTVFTKMPYQGIDVAWIRETGNRMLNKLLESEDIGIMSGDILKAYGSNVYTISTIPETYSVLPSYSEEVNMQIHNLRSMSLPGGYDPNVFNITQDVNSGALIYKPKFAAGRPGYDFSTVLDMYTSDVSPEHTMVATRLSFSAVAGRDAVSTTTTDPNGDSYTFDSVIYEITSCGSELVGSVYTYTINEDNTLTLDQNMTSELYALNSDGWYIAAANRIVDTQSMLQSIARYACFDWAPLVRLWVWKNSMDSNNNVVTEIATTGYANDIDNYAVIDGNTLESINDVALLSLLDVPAGV